MHQAPMPGRAVHIPGLRVGLGKDRRGGVRAVRRRLAADTRQQAAEALADRYAGHDS